MSGYWHGTVMCPRKGLSHISNERCLELYDTDMCGPCKNKFHILQEQQEDLMLEKKKKAERLALKPTRGRKLK
jgi:hypothetical protein